MAKVIFKAGAGIENLSGTIGGVTYRTRNGQTYVHERSKAVLPKDATRKEKALYKRRVMIDNCIEILQGQYEDFVEAIAMRPKMKARLVGLYKRYAPEIKAPTKLQCAIMREYYRRFGKEKYEKTT